MILGELVDLVVGDVREHCKGKGYVPGPWLNPLTPYDCVAAFQMAKYLTEEGIADRYVAVAPEGHVYGYFLEKFGARILSVFVDYPPTRIEASDDFVSLVDQRVLIIEDDVISGTTLRLVVDALEARRPRSLSLYLGRAKEDQQLESVPSSIDATFLAEEYLDYTKRSQHEREFFGFFRARLC